MRTKPLSPRILVLGGAVFGLLMTLAATAWLALVRRRAVSALFPPPAGEALAVGALAGAAFAAVEWIIFRCTPLMHNEVARLDRLINLPAFRWHHVVAIALLAAAPEELLFRGALLPEVGVLISALLFGLAHAISRQYFVYASAAGLLCGLLMTWTGGLWAPTAAHAVIDILMLTWLIRARPPGGWSPAEPGEEAPDAAP